MRRAGRMAHHAIALARDDKANYSIVKRALLISMPFQPNTSVTIDRTSTSIKTFH
jgi:hypothetical protein